MVEININRETDFFVVNISGRIDSMSASDVQKEIEGLIQDGERRIVICLKAVNYLSSAGLRVFLASQKQMRKISGQLLFFQVPDNIYDIFKMTGMTQLFEFCATQDELDNLLRPGALPDAVKTLELDGLQFHYAEKSVDKGNLHLIGRHDKLPTATFSEQDVVSIKSSDFQFATGLATLGEKYDDFKSFFGEAMIVNHSLFFYPAVKRPTVDYMLNLSAGFAIDYKFFHGFGFNGPLRHLVVFEAKEGFVELSRLADSLLTVSGSNLAGLIFIAESKGLWGMNLKSVPVLDNKPQNDRDIFDPENFTDWVNFPVEPDDIHNIVVGVGIAAKNPTLLKPDVAALFSRDSSVHIHGGIFTKGPVSKQFENFETELNRVISELEILKVQHLLGKSLVSGGLAAIIDLEE